MSAAALACVSGVFLAACSAGEGDDPESESNANFGPAGTGGASSTTPASNGGPGAVVPGAAGSGSATPSPSGNGEAPGSNVNNVVPPPQMTGGGNQNGGAAGSGGVQNGGAAGSGGMQNGGAAGSGSQPPPPPAGVGRVGVELCPQGPFGEPLPANPVVTKLFSVGADNFFNFEGPVWVGDALYFSEIGGGQNPPPSNINRFRPGGMLERGVIPNSGSNGLAVDADGNLIAATHDVGAISTFTVPGGARGQLGAQTFNDTRFNSPNDLVERADGNIYFTDPSFQAPGNPQGSTRVYRIPPQGAATVVDGTLSNPNGITLSPDGNTLYVTSASGFRRYELAADGTPGPAITINLADGLQTPDGMGMDCAGNVYTVEHFRRLIRVFDPQGNQIGSFGGPAVFDRDVTNVAFGGADRRTMFITTLTQGQQGGLFQVQLNIPGFAY